MSLDVLVVSYNFERQIVNCLLSVSRACEYWGGKYRIILFDDCSSDNTLELVQSLSVTNLQVVRSEKNLGAGYSLLEGLKYVEAEYCTVLDGDDMVHLNRFKHHFDNILQLDINVAYFTAHKKLGSMPVVIGPEYILKFGIPAQYGGLTFPRSAIEDLIKVPPFPIFDFTLVYLISRRCVIRFDPVILVSYLPSNGVTREGYGNDWALKMYKNLQYIINYDPRARKEILRSLIMKSAKLLLSIPLRESLIRFKLILKVCTI